MKKHKKNKDIVITSLFFEDDVDSETILKNNESNDKQFHNNNYKYYCNNSIVLTKEQYLLGTFSRFVLGSKNLFFSSFSQLLFNAHVECVFYNLVDGDHYLCPICLSNMNSNVPLHSPILVSCGHSFCLPCFFEYFFQFRGVDFFFGLIFFWLILHPSAPKVNWSGT